MEQEFEKQVYDAACMAMGEAVWQLAVSGEIISQEAILIKVFELSEIQLGIAESVALSILITI